VGPWQTFACDLPVAQSNPKETFVASNRTAGNDVLLPLQIATANVASEQVSGPLPSDTYRRGLRPLRSHDVEVPPAASAHQTDVPFAK
jgi:hypothetical protein